MIPAHAYAPGFLIGAIIFLVGTGLTLGYCLARIIHSDQIDGGDEDEGGHG